MSDMQTIQSAIPSGTSLETALEQLLAAYQGYYNINRETPLSPFAAEAVFQVHDEQYFLMKSARLTQYDSSEHIFFALEEELTQQRLKELDELVWSECLRRAAPGPAHRGTDAGLCILTNHLTPEAEALVPKLKHSKSWRFGLQGYSQYRLIALDLSNGGLVRNRMGDTLEKTIRNIFFA